MIFSFIPSPPQVTQVSLSVLLSFMHPLNISLQRPPLCCGKSSFLVHIIDKSVPVRGAMAVFVPYGIKCAAADEQQPQHSSLFNLT